MTETIHHEYFPFETIGQYGTLQEAMAAGWDRDQIWSFAIHEDTFVYGPPHHYVNVMGYYTTHERHDGETYYEEPGDVDDPCHS